MSNTAPDGATENPAGSVTGSVVRTGRGRSGGPSRVNKRRISVALIGLLVLVLGGWLVQQQAGTSDSARLPVQPLSSLPAQVEQTRRLIEAGGPFPYPGKDGEVFGNRERLLPEHPAGYYREYTVPTPGASDRGARRLVTGQGKELYYTQDHFGSFVAVDLGR